MLTFTAAVVSIVSRRYVYKDFSIRL